MKTVRFLLWAGGIITGGFAATLFVGWWQVDGPGSSPQQSTKQSALPLPLHNMDFRLTDHKGRKVRPASWISRPTLVFFGFTYCPDICPTTLSNISDWLGAIGENTSQLNVVFITVDPERDNVDVMKEYVSNFHPAIVGYTGSSEDISKAAADFRVKYERIPMREDYTMNHTAGVFVFNKHGQFISIIDDHEPRETAVAKIRRAL